MDSPLKGRTLNRPSYKDMADRLKVDNAKQEEMISELQRQLTNANNRIVKLEQEAAGSGLIDDQERRTHEAIMQQRNYLNREYEKMRALLALVLPMLAKELNPYEDGE